jgi:xylitol oxidase
VLPVVALLDERLTPLGGRPHWGKVFTTPPDVLRGLYPQLGEFEALRRELDPRGVFRNDLLDRYLPVS